MNTSTESKMTDLGRTLIKMREWLSDPKRWTQGALYKDKRGRQLIHPDIANKNTSVACTCLVSAFDIAEGYMWHQLTNNLSNNPDVKKAYFEFKNKRGAFFGLMSYYPENQPRAGERMSPVTDWNDTPGRTHAEVLELLDHAIEQERLEAEAAQ